MGDEIIRTDMVIIFYSLKDLVGGRHYSSHFTKVGESAYGGLNRGYRHINFFFFFFFLKKVKMIYQGERYISNRSIYVRELNQQWWWWGKRSKI